VIGAEHQDTFNPVGAPWLMIGEDPSSAHDGGLLAALDLTVCVCSGGPPRRLGRELRHDPAVRGADAD
jgi:hypothetical protein